MKNGTATLGNRQNLKMLVVYNIYIYIYIYIYIHLAVAFLGFYPREMKAYVHTKTCIQVFIMVLFIVIKSWRQSKCPSTGEWRNKL